MCFDVSIPIRLICSTGGLLCLRSTATSFWHARCRRGPSTPTDGRGRDATTDVPGNPVADRPTAGTACASMSEQRDQMRQATSAKVCLDLAKSARFIVSALSTASFNRPLLALSTICRCPSRSKERSWPRNRGHLANVHLYHSSLRSDDVRIARNGESIPFRDLSRSVANDSEGGLEALYQEYRSESSIVLLFLHERWPPLKMLCQSLAREFSSRIQANMYLSPPQSQALKTHYDTHDVLVLQIHGKKRWRLFDRAVQLPLSHQRYTRSCHRRGPRCRLARPSTVTCTTPTRLGSGPSSRLNTRLRCRCRASDG